MLREQAVDQAVVALNGRRKAYLEALLIYQDLLNHKSKLDQTSLGSTWVGSMALAFQQSHLRQRVAQLTEEKRMSKLLALTASAGFAFALMLAGFLTAMVSPQAAIADDTVHVHTVDEKGVTKPIRLVGPGPGYPEMPKEEKVEGSVVVRVVIGPTGQIGNAEVLQSIGPRFDQAVLDVLPDWRFEPATLDGEPISVRYHLTFRFRLDDKNDDTNQGETQKEAASR